jgi:hypothetical protein
LAACAHIRKSWFVSLFVPVGPPAWWRGPVSEILLAMWSCDHVSEIAVAETDEAAFLCVDRWGVCVR